MAKKQKQANFVPAGWAKNLVRKFDLGCLETLIQKSDFFDEETQKSLKDQFDLIRSRATDEFFRLAVIGEFSSGKSTLINALIGEKLLKQGSSATTAAATHIRTGEKREIYTVSNKDGSPKKKRVRPRLFESFRKAISRITADEETAKTIERVEIVVPAKFKIPNLEIIDTPGFDSGEERGLRHRKVTENVVKNVADCVLVCVPAGRAGTRELKDFLKKNVPAGVANEAFFILTHADMIDEDEDDLDDVLARVAREIQKTFKTEHTPTIFPVNSANELAEKSSPEWSEKFQTMLGSLRERLDKNRARILRERLKSLALQLCTDLGNAQTKRLDDIKKRTDFIAEHKVERIEKITNDMLKGTESELADLQKNSFEPLADSIAGQIEEDAENLRNKSSNIIQGLRNGRSDESVQRAINNAQKAFVKKWEQNARTECKEYQLEIDGIHDKFIAEFESHYEGFPALRDPIDSDFKSADFNFEDVDIHFEGSSVLDDVEDWLSSKFLGRHSVSVIQNCWANARRKLNSFCKDFSNEMHTAIYNIPYNAQQQFRELAERHKQTYGERIGRLIRQQERELTNLKQEHRALLKDWHAVKNILRRNKENGK